MNIIVIGAGAMGGSYGGRLSLCNRVTLVDTNASLVDRINASGLVLEEGGRETVFHPSAATGVCGHDKADLVVLFTKALYSRSALENVKGAIGDDTVLMSLQNGAGHERVLCEYVPRERVVIGTTEDNGYVISEGRIHHGGEGVTNIGVLDGVDGSFLEDIRQAFEPCGFTVRIHADIRRLVWDKLMTNVSLSALTAVLQCDMGYIYNDRYARNLCTQLVKEAVAVANAQGLGFDEEAVLAKVVSVSRANPGAYTSIMKDIAAGRRTEVDTISGEVVSAAHSLGLSVPHHEMIVSLIHAMEGRGCQGNSR